MIRTLRQIKWMLQWLLATKSWFWTTAFMKHRIPPTYQVQTIKDGDLLLSNSGFIIPRKESVRNLIEAFDELDALGLAGAKFTAHPQWDQIELRGLHFNIYTPQSVRILSEVFLLGVYEVFLPNKPVVIDIGMNVGISSLFFAKTLECPVYGYEPFEDTFTKATDNFSLNPSYSREIHPFHCGVGSRNRKEEFMFCAEASGDSGIVQIPEVYLNGRQFRPEMVEIRSAAEVLDFVIRKEASRNIFLKIDCEGMEYEIIESLAGAGLLSRIWSMVIEWHRRGNLGDPDDIQSVLTANGFVVFGNPHKTSEVGLFYAVRCSTDLK